jgi:hypothetical protein
MATAAAVTRGTVKVWEAVEAGLQGLSTATVTGPHQGIGASRGTGEAVGVGRAW